MIRASLNISIYDLNRSLERKNMKEHCSLIENLMCKCKCKPKPSLYSKAKSRWIFLEIDFIVSNYMNQSESIQTKHDQRQLTKV